MGNANYRNARRGVVAALPDMAAAHSASAVVDILRIDLRICPSSGIRLAASDDGIGLLLQRPAFLVWRVHRGVDPGVVVCRGAVGKGITGSEVTLVSCKGEMEIGQARAVSPMV